MYHTQSERQTGKKLMKARVDAGREWVNEMWNTYCANHGIVLVVTMPYAHAQNGYAKQCIQTVIKGVHYVLAKSKLPKCLWAEAAATRN